MRGHERVRRDERGLRHLLLQAVSRAVHRAGRPPPEGLQGRDRGHRGSRVRETTKGRRTTKITKSFGN